MIEIFIFSWKIKFCFQAEKESLTYRLKREKNNDAVRKSRSKAKQQQKMKDVQIASLQCCVKALEKTISEKESRISVLQNLLKDTQNQNKKLSNELKTLKRQINMLNLLNDCCQCSRKSDC